MVVLASAWVNRATVAATVGPVIVPPEAIVLAAPESQPTLIVDPAAAVVVPAEEPVDVSGHALFGRPKFTVARDADDVTTLTRPGFTVGHDNDMKQPAWVAYRWTLADLRRSEAVSFDRFRAAADEELPRRGQAQPSLQHSETGLQRGHLHRDADAEAWGRENVRLAGLMSNMVPQLGSLNADGWLRLEDAHRHLVEDAAAGVDRLWVVAGPVFDSETPRRVGNGVAVPDGCFKVVAWLEDDTLHARAFILPQRADAPLSAYLTSVDEVEARTGLDLFPAREFADVEATRPWSIAPLVD